MFMNVRSLKILSKIYILMFLSYFCASTVLAQAIEGSWTYVRHVNVSGIQDRISTINFPFAQSIRQKIAFTPNCILHLTKEKASIKSLFDEVIKTRMRGENLKLFLAKFVDANRKNSPIKYKVEQHDCADNVQEVVVNRGEMIAIGSEVIYFYTRNLNKNPNLISNDKKIKFSGIPFSPSNFSMLCGELVAREKGMPQQTMKCAPLYIPYVAKESDSEPLSKIVGHHRYAKGRSGPHFFSDYDDPFSNGLHPVYMVLPPLKKIQLVRVDDSEGNADERDKSGGAYLSIRDGLVIDQLDEACDMNADYVCSYGARGDVFRLLETGRFKKIQ